ncbi:MAG: aspartate--ammonia ligase [Sedimentibacter saalensis]|uniref:Aspartate--ammonia ligase n=1 Tax=Sedimentibacter saalensis TaxID=130788 RepID=A0A562J647_9FIRM|nr:aspartate--ammonia ligase [Sedimentibacter saalensis]MEA5094663.1 aspartate--ammonia ligase [Sedimentibacter saalensis]TWH78414.1 aspartate-ammonia ligase [Sedimentibacter saalensis]
MSLENLIIPENYTSKLSLLETQIAIKKIKDFFEGELSKNLSLIRVSAPLMVRPESGLNDDLNGIERAVRFDMLDTKYDVEIVQSLAKWKRNALGSYRFDTYTGLYTDMNAIRRDEDLDNIHSIYVDQWDWEKIIKKTDRSKDTLKYVVTQIYNVFRSTEKYLESLYPFLRNELPSEIHFITTQELLDLYPDKTPKEREYLITKEKKAVFLMEVGKKLSDGKIHDGRAADYDDWSLNGDILFYFSTLDIALELSSMGIRVDKDALLSQLEERNQMHKSKFPFHQDVINERVPFTIGGGIGQSRICMFFLQKAHIGEVQSSVWPENMIELCKKNEIHLL